MLTERSRNKALEAFLKGRKVIVVTVFDNGSIVAENLENILSTEDSRYLVDVPAAEDPEFKQAVADMFSDGQKQKGIDACTDCFGVAGNDCRDCVRGEDGA